MVVGSVMTDLTAFAKRIPETGETLVGASFQTGFGGKGANQAVMARLWKAEVTIVCCVGDDSYGNAAIANFAEREIDTSYIRRVDSPSGVASIWVDAKGMNRIIIIPGSNEELSAQQATEAINGERAPAVVLGQLETPQEATAAAFKAGRERGAVNILNPAPAAQILPELLAVTDWLIPNEVEFAALSVARGADLSNDDALLRVAGAVGCRLLVTLGEAGAALAGMDGRVYRRPAAALDAVDTTGAGDAFVGSFAYALAAGLEERRAMRLALAVASDSTLRAGTQSSFPDPEACQTLLAQI